DLPFAQVGMKHGYTYDISITAYVADDVSVPEGAQALLQNVDSYNGLYVPADYVAGEAFTLKGTFKVDTGQDRALRIQSNEAGKEVPFYVGEVVIVEVAGPSADEAAGPVIEDDREPALPFVPITFEDGTAGGFVGR